MELPFRPPGRLDTVFRSFYDPAPIAMLPTKLPDLKDDPHLKVIRPLVEAYLAFSRTDNRHIRAMKLTSAQFDVIATLGDTDGLTCSGLSQATLVTKGTLTGVLDRLAAKGLIRRDPDSQDRRAVRIRLTEKGDALFRKTYGAHITYLRPFFERALNKQQAAQAADLLTRIRNSFTQPR
ncbi:MAG: MarR family winged helix-turn-helix transcriptional regulator [Nitrospiraceae bacterium]